MLSDVGRTESCQTSMMTWGANEIYIPRPNDGDIYRKYWIYIDIQETATNWPTQNTPTFTQSHRLKGD
jgi:hypothetical protein